MHDFASDKTTLPRRRYLKLLATAGAVPALAGCTGDSDDDTGAGTGSGAGTDAGNGSSTVQPGSGGGFNCSDLSLGTQVFDPDGRDFQVVWDYPASFDDVEREMANSSSLAGARLGHVATKQPGFWPFMIQVNQSTAATDAESAQRYVENPAYVETTPIDYEGQSVARSTAVTGTNHTWNIAIPGTVAGEFFVTTLTLAVDGDAPYVGCEHAAVAVTEGIMGSFRPNPAL